METALSINSKRFDRSGWAELAWVATNHCYLIIWQLLSELIICFVYEMSEISEKYTFYFFASNWTIPAAVVVWCVVVVLDTFGALPSNINLKDFFEKV